MTGKKISKQQILVMAGFIAEPRQWQECRDIEHKSGVSGSTVRHLLLTLFRLGLLERSEVLGGYRYRLSSTAQAQPYFRRMQEAMAVMQTQSSATQDSARSRAMYGPPVAGRARQNSAVISVAKNKERDMTKFERFLKQLDEEIVSCKQSGLEYMSYKPRYFSVLDGHVLAGVQIFLPPTPEHEGRLLYVSTSMKVWFGEIDPILDAEECAELGVPEEGANYAEAGIYGDFKVVGREGIRSLLSMATDNQIFSTATLDMMGLGIEPLGTRARF